jgi:hypothetical protein
MLQVLTQPHQEDEPAASALVIEEFLPIILKEYLQAEPGMLYHRPHSEEYLDYRDQGTWQADRFVQLMICTYMLPVHRDTVAPFHAALVPFYKLLAERQKKAIKEACAAYEQGKARRKQREMEEKNRTGAAAVAAAHVDLARAATALADLESAIQSVERSGKSPHLVEEELARLRHQKQELLGQIRSLRSASGL